MATVPFRRPATSIASSLSLEMPSQLQAPASLNLNQRALLQTFIDRLSRLPSARINAALVVGDAVLRSFGV